MDDLPWRSLRAVSQAAVRTRLDLAIDGVEHLPTRGPAIIAARHVHHLYDGCIFLVSTARPMYILVAHDWIRRRSLRLLMGRTCELVRWPAILRTDQLAATSRIAGDPEAMRYLRRAVADSIQLLREGRLLVVFPEGYPNVDHVATPKRNDEAFLPFQSGFVRLAEIAGRGGSGPVPIVPAGVTFRRGRRWRVTLRYGPPIFVRDGCDRDDVAHAVEAQVRALSRVG